MAHVQDELHEAKELAHSLEQSLQDKYQSGKQAIRRASHDFTSTVSHALDDVVGAVAGSSSTDNVTTSTHRRGSHEGDTLHRGRIGRHHGHVDDHEGGWCGQICNALRHHFTNCAGACGFSTCISEYWKRVHDIGSTSLGFVWITFVLELLVFLTAAFSQHDHKVNVFQLGGLKCYTMLHSRY